MNMLETTARYSVAISVLNSFRHWLMGRAGAEITDKEAEILGESIDINQSSRLSSNMILYSLQGFSNDDRSAAIELSDALAQALGSMFEGPTKDEFLRKTKTLLESRQISELPVEDKSALMDIVKKSMHIISSATEEKPKSAFAWKSL
jgi:hypothetical protein